MKKLAFLVALASVSTASLADNYFGFQYGKNDLNIAGLEVGTMNFVLGKEFNENVSGEFRIGVGIKDDEIFGVNVSAEPSFGAYFRIQPAAAKLNPYLLLGFSKASIDVNSPSLSGSDSDTDFSYGAGLSLNLSEQAALTLEYLEVVEDIDSINLGFRLSM